LYSFLGSPPAGPSYIGDYMDCGGFGVDF